MQYAKVSITPEREVLVASDLTNWGAPYRELFEQAGDGWPVHAAYAHNGFRNPFHDADVERHQKRGGWAEIYRILVEGRDKERGETPPGEGFVPVIYRANAGLPIELVIPNAWLPPVGLYAPVRDDKTRYRFFKPGTIIPELVLPFDRRAEVENIFSQFDLPLEEISGFLRLDNYRNVRRFAGRGFGPGWDVDGRFGVGADWLPSVSGDGWVASRPRYEEPEIIMTVNTVPQEVKAK